MQHFITLVPGSLETHSEASAAMFVACILVLGLKMVSFNFLGQPMLIAKEVSKINKMEDKF
jgi:hypothetical protein